MNELALFIHQLVNAGMSIENAISHGFTLAMEYARIDDDLIPRSEKERMIIAAQMLEKASFQAGIHLEQQRAIMEHKA